MKLSFLLIFFSVFNLSASVYSQNTRINIQLKNTTVHKLLKTIQETTEFRFFYNDELIEGQPLVSVNAIDETVESILNESFKKTDLTYKIVDKIIYVSKKQLQTVQNIASETPVPQKKELKGTVTDVDGKPIPGVSVVLKGTTIGVATDNLGKFVLNVDELKGTLSLSFIGMKQQEIKIDGKSSFTIVLESSTSELDEVIAVGYGTAKKKDLTGAVTRISAKTIENSSYTDVGKIMQGQVSGMEVISGNGRPGDQVRIRIRGESSLQGDASPLFVIDEVPMPDGYDINLINPADIQSIDILKGASAAAIYGSKGSAGVVLITTKQGKTGGFEIFYDGNASTQGYVTKIQGLNAEDYKAMVLNSVPYNFIMAQTRTPATNKDIRTSSEFTFVATPNYFGTADTDWSKVLTQTPLNTNNTLGIKGGSKEASYYASFNYMKDKGLVIGNENNRLALNFKMDLRPTKYFEMGFNVGITNKPSKIGEAMSTVYTMRPDIPVYDNAGDYYRFWSIGHNRYLDNPLQMARYASSTSKIFDYKVNGYGRLILAKDFRLQTTYSYYESKSDGSKYYPSYSYVGSGDYYRGVTGILNTSSGYAKQINWDNSILYTKTLDKHDISLMLGTSFNMDEDGSLKQSYQNFPDDYIQNTIYNATKWNSSSGSDDASAYYSVYGRANYKFDDRYLLTATFRRDASSKFSTTYRAGLFPSAALAWVISEEGFMKGKPLGISFLKLRTGYGVTGNNRIGRYTWRTLFQTSSYFEVPGAIPVSVGNENVKWEETNQLDLALDFGFWKNRIMGSVGYYSKITGGLLYAFQLAPSSGLTNLNMNLARIENKGLEFEIKADVVETTDWNVSLSGNISGNRGKVLNLDKDIAPGPNGGSITGTSIVLKEGEPTGLIYGYRIAGIMTSPQQAMEIYLAQKDNIPGYGRYYYKDLNGDGLISVLDDREVIGKTEPDFFGGFKADVRYKRLTATLYGKFSYGSQKYWGGLRDQFHANLYNPLNTLTYSLYGWTPDNPESKLQRFGAGWEKGLGDNYIFDASYLKFTDFRIGYDLPEKWMAKIGISTMNINASVNNLLTLTTYPGTNVESSSGGLGGTAIDNSVYPMVRTFTLGVKLMFR